MNLALAARRAASGSTFRCRARLATTNSRSPISSSRLAWVRAGIDDFPGFLGDFLHHLGGIIPVESDACGAALKFFGTQQGGQGDGNIVQEAGLAGLGLALRWP